MLLLPGYGSEKHRILIGYFMSVSLDKVRFLVYSVYTVRKGSEAKHILDMAMGNEIERLHEKIRTLQSENRSLQEENEKLQRALSRKKSSIIRSL